MPDITMCMNIECPFREQCYRYRAIPSDFQSYADFQPKMEHKTFDCDNFWDIKGRKIDDFDKTEFRNKVLLKNKGMKNG